MTLHARPALGTSSEPDAAGPPGPQDGSWKPYEMQWTETPWAFMRLVPRSWYKVRWMAWYPLQWRVAGGRCTLGELLLMMLSVSLVAVGCVGTWKSVFASGRVAGALLALVWMFSCRNSLMTFLLGLPFERALSWHKYLSYLATLVGTYHGIMSYVVFYIQTGDINGSAWEGLGGGAPTLTPEQEEEWTKMKISGWIFIGFIFLIIIVSSIRKIRQYHFEWFLRIHWVLFLAVAAMAFVHKAWLVAIGLGLWIFDLLLRFVMAGTKHPHELQLKPMPGNIVRCAFEKTNFEYSCGQHVVVCIPEISPWEWHPFSISSSPDEVDVTMHIKVRGNWTKRLYDLAIERSCGAQATGRIRAYFEGPYGSPSVDMASDRYKLFLFVAGGIGVTPLLSMYNSLVCQHRRGRPMHKVWFVWAVRDGAILRALVDPDMLNGGSADVEGVEVELKQDGQPPEQLGIGQANAPELNHKTAAPSIGNDNPVDCRSPPEAGTGALSRPRILVHSKSGSFKQLATSRAIAALESGELVSPIMPSPGHTARLPRSQTMTSEVGSVAEHVLALPQSASPTASPAKVMPHTLPMANPHPEATTPSPPEAVAVDMASLTLAPVAIDLYEPAVSLEATQLGSELSSLEDSAHVCSSGASTPSQQFCWGSNEHLPEVKDEEAPAPKPLSSFAPPFPLSPLPPLPRTGSATAPEGSASDGQPNCFAWRRLHRSGSGQMRRADSAASGAGGDMEAVMKELMELERADDPVVHTQFYITQKPVAQEAALPDLPEYLSPFTHAGRPDLEAKFHHMQLLALAHQQSRVAVLACGPGPMTREVRRLCAEWSRKGITFHCHTEEFKH